MRTVSIFKNGKNQAIQLPKDMAFEGVSELEIVKVGDVVTLRPSRPSWLSLADSEAADKDFLLSRENVVSDEGGVEWQPKHICWIHVFVALLCASSLRHFYSGYKNGVIPASYRGLRHYLR